MGNWIKKMLKSSIVQDGEREVSIDEENVFKGKYFQGNLIRYQSGTMILHIVRYKGDSIYPLDKGAAQHVARKIENFFKDMHFNPEDIFVQLPPGWTSVELVIKSKKVFGYRTRNIMREVMREL